MITFQDILSLRGRKMSEILNELEGVVCLMDNVLVFGRNHEEHNKQLKTVLQKLNESKVTLNREKCEFAQPEIKFLGQVGIATS